ncbi:MAG: RluA family pseudouridine synthase [Planctomycetaceae bacterium]
MKSAREISDAELVTAAYQPVEKREATLPPPLGEGRGGGNLRENAENGPHLGPLPEGEESFSTVCYPFTAELTVEKYLHGVRIDSFLVKHFRNYTPFRMQRLVAAGQVRIEGAVAEADSRVYFGQSVQVRLLEPPDHLLPPEPRSLDILFEDDWLIVLNKPADLVVHPCGNYVTGSLANALQAHFDAQTRLRGLIRPGIVHRLDRLTSGVMVCTKDHLAHRKLGIHWEEGRIHKTYLALVHGRVPQDQGEIDLPIGNFPGGGTIRMSTAPDAIDPRPSRTRYSVSERFEGHTLVSAQPLTGRLHQIRVHLAAIGHPVVADEFYSASAEFRHESGPANERASAAPSDPAGAVAYDGESNGRNQGEKCPEATLDESPVLLARQALHAHRLKFIHPITRELLEFTAPLAEDIKHVLSVLRQTTAGRGSAPSIE